MSERKIKSASTMVVIVLLCVAAATSKTIEPEVEWERTLGGSGLDNGHSIQLTSDGGYIIAGSTYSYVEEEADVYLIKTDSQGNALWEKTFGGSGNDFGGSVQQTSDGGYIIAGSTASYGAGGTDVYLIKTDSNGNKIWERTFGESNDDRGESVQETSDGGYIIAGSTASYGAGEVDVYLIKTDSDGNTLWEKTFGGSGLDHGRSVQLISDGCYIIVGHTDSYGAGEVDVYLIKSDLNGNILWEKTFGGNDLDRGRSVQQTSDGGYIIAGYTASYGAGEVDVYLIKTDLNGGKLWEKTFGEKGLDCCHAVQQTSDGGYIIAGETYSYGAGDLDVYLVKTDSNGIKTWEKILGGSKDDRVFSVQQTSDGGYIIAGYTDSYGAGASDVYLIKLSADTIEKEIIYVDDDANGLNDGSRWDNAYQCLQDALTNAKAGDEIWVAAGVYKPDQRYSHGRRPIIISSGIRTETFRLKQNVTIKGGYAGVGADDPNERNIALYQTILSGDLSSNDVNVADLCNLLEEVSRSENSYHIVTIMEVDESSLLEGFTLTGGNCDGFEPECFGGAIYITQASPTISNCTVTGNKGEEAAGIACALGSSPTIKNCTISRNAALWGAGIACWGSSNPTLTDCTVTQNWVSQEGAGMNNIDSSNPIIINSTFSYNRAEHDCGGIGNGNNSSPTVINCLFIGNSGNAGAGMLNCNHCNPILTNCIFRENTALMAAGISNENDSNSKLKNCIFIRNMAEAHGGAIGNYESRPTIINCTFSGNLAAIGCGLYNHNDSNPILTNCILWDGGNEIWNEDNSSVMIAYSDIQGGRASIYDPNESIVWGKGNIDSDPLFAIPGYWIDVNDFDIVVEPNDPNAVWIEGDYHLKSEVGRWDPNSKIWVADDVTSPCIDAGDPNSNWTAELWPHGKRINIGAYGGTAEASMSLSQIGDCRDLNNNDFVTYDDVLLLAEKWDCNDVPLKQDLNLDGIVDANDLIFFEGNWTEDSNNIAPALDFIDDQYTAVGELLSFSVTAVDNDGDELVYLALGLPDGAVFDEQLFSWAPEQPGTYPVTFVVSDYKSLDFMTVRITVDAVVVQDF